MYKAAQCKAVTLFDELRNGTPDGQWLGVSGLEKRVAAYPNVLNNIPDTTLMSSTKSELVPFLFFF